VVISSMNKTKWYYVGNIGDKIETK
jgi:hypothetical protein